jgi:hypothetical protein
LEVQQREFKAERQQQTRELCLQLSTELDNANKVVYPVRRKDAEMPTPNRLYEHAARWDGLSHRAALVAPLVIYDAVQNVSSVLRDASVAADREKWRREIEESYREREKALREIEKALRQLEGGSGGGSQQEEEPQQEVEEPKYPARQTFENAAHQLRNACRTEMGEQPLPTPSQR